MRVYLAADAFDLPIRGILLRTVRKQIAKRPSRRREVHSVRLFQWIAIMIPTKSSNMQKNGFSPGVSPKKTQNATPIRRKLP